MYLLPTILPNPIMKKPFLLTCRSNDNGTPLDSSSFQVRRKKPKMYLSHQSSSNHTSSSHSSKYSRSRNPDEFDVYTIDPTAKMKKRRNLCQKFLRFIKSNWLVVQVVTTLLILGLPGNIVTVILHFRDTHGNSTEKETFAMRHPPTSNEG